ncbi:mechanosensitive ion channel family protein [Krasilnikovia sp. M28-CT-15]|uniref:mechanosensitive ion channel family protein n=1 Tax=Krasilnikovia sp. M28-CT-15 TaxID=3373540 RepID=UPI003876B013
MSDFLNALLAVVLAAGAAIVFVEAVHWVLTRYARRSALLSRLERTAHKPFLTTVTLFAVQQALRPTAGREVLHILVILVIMSGAWLVGALLLVLEDAALSRWRTDVPDNRKARKVRTQVVMLRRVTVAGIVVVAFGVALMTFPAVRALGASLLASAGIFSVVAAVAAQSTLGNVFAGIQLAFSDAIRIDDVVVVEQEWGRIEEITLTYVALQVWDDRRLILPTSYFTTKPFQNWTRTGSAVLGTAEIDVDFATAVEPLRAELRAVCESTELWDGRVCVLQVTDAVRGMVRLRALVSAHDAPSLWDLRCLVRERLVAWVWEHQRESLPRYRAETLTPTPDPVRPVSPPAADTAPPAADTAPPAADTAPPAADAGPPAAAGVKVPPVSGTRAPSPDRARVPDALAPGAALAGERGDDARVFSGGSDGESRGATFVGPPGPDAQQ